MWTRRRVAPVVFWSDCRSQQSHATKPGPPEAGPDPGLGVKPRLCGVLSKCRPPNETEPSVSSISLRSCHGGPSPATQVCKQNQALCKSKRQGSVPRINSVTPCVPESENGETAQCSSHRRTGGVCVCVRLCACVCVCVCPLKQTGRMWLTLLRKLADSTNTHCNSLL